MVLLCWVWLIAGGLLTAQRDLPVVVRDVQFGTARAPGVDDPHYEIGIELEALSAGTSGDFVRGIDVALQLATRARQNGAEGNAYYEARVRLVGLEVGERRVVYFYLPPEIVERDQLRGADPVGWRVVLGVDGVALPNAPRSYSDNLRDSRIAESFLAQIQQQAPANEGILQPIYMTPFDERDADRREDSPSYIRTEPVSGETAESGL